MAEQPNEPSVIQMLAALGDREDISEEAFTEITKIINALSVEIRRVYEVERFMNNWSSSGRAQSARTMLSAARSRLGGIE